MIPPFQKQKTAGFTLLETSCQRQLARRRRASLTGFTLIETVIVISIYTLALGALVNLFLIFNSLYNHQQAFIVTAGSAGTSVNALEAAILPADHVLASYSFSGTTYSSATTTLVLELPSLDSSGVAISGTKDYIVFYRSGSTLYRLTQAHATSARVSGLQQLSTTVNSLIFTYDSSDFTQVTNVTVDILTQSQVKLQTIQSRLQERLYLRNL